jgi:hypothetical protein
MIYTHTSSNNSCVAMIDMESNSNMFWVASHVSRVFPKLMTRNSYLAMTQNQIPIYYSPCPQKNAILIFRGVNKFKLWLKYIKKY